MNAGMIIEKNDWPSIRIHIRIPTLRGPEVTVPFSASDELSRRNSAVAQGQL
jgi:hypothetical protein